MGDGEERHPYGSSPAGVLGGGKHLAVAALQVVVDRDRIVVPARWIYGPRDGALAIGETLIPAAAERQPPPKLRQDFRIVGVKRQRLALDAFGLVEVAEGELDRRQRLQCQTTLFSGSIATALEAKSSACAISRGISGVRTYGVEPIGKNCHSGCRDPTRAGAGARLCLQGGRDRPRKRGRAAGAVGGPVPPRQLRRVGAHPATGASAQPERPRHDGAAWLAAGPSWPLGGGSCHSERAIARTINPPGWYYDTTTIHLYLKGRYREMLASAQHSAAGDYTGVSLLAIAHGALGNHAAAQEALATMAEQAPAFNRDPAAVWRRFHPLDSILDALMAGLRKAGWTEPRCAGSRSRGRSPMTWTAQDD